MINFSLISLACDRVIGVQVILTEGDNKQVALTITGLTEYGYLSAVDAEGNAFALHPDGNRYGSAAVHEHAHPSSSLVLLLIIGI